MVDDPRPTPEEAREWLHDHFEGDPAPRVTLTWELDPTPRPAQRQRLLEILFGEDTAA